MIYKYKESVIKGVFELYPSVYEDERGSITKTFHKESFMELNLECDWGESLITENYKKGVIRGFHFQRPPFCQAKTIFCISGSIMDAVIDLRRGSESYGQTAMFTLNHIKRNILYIPKGVANCYMIQENNTVIAYNLTSKYMPEYDSGIRWDSVGIKFGDVKPIITEKDSQLPSFKDFESPFIYGNNC